MRGSYREQVCVLNQESILSESWESNSFRKVECGVVETEEFYTLIVIGMK